jgi:gamma-glutamyltranspeptidase/glutathione hydrolase
LVKHNESGALPVAANLKDPLHRQVTGSSAMVVTAFPLASDAAIEILRAGGNAIDAAVAAAWALTVCEPSGSGLGGQTTMLVRFATGRILVIDGHSHAPAAVCRKHVSRKQQMTGYRSCTIPTTPATLESARQRYGRLPLALVMTPAIRIAENGYAITRLQRRQMRWCHHTLLASPATAALFLNHGRPFHAGSIFRQKELASTLGRLVEFGVDDFYQGSLARDIAEDMRRNGGLITERDLSDCNSPVERDAVIIRYGNYDVAGVPPPGGGLQVLLGLQILTQLLSGDRLPTREQWYEFLADVTHGVFQERDRQRTHPADLTPSLLEWLVSERRASDIAGRILHLGNQHAGAADMEEPGETTHLCVVDGDGNAVSLTQSIQSLFGAKVAHGQLGFLYNNYLCTCTRRRHPYRLGSGCIPESNIAPTLVLRRRHHTALPAFTRGDDPSEPFLLLGAAGSRRITSAILQVISGILDCGMSLEEAVKLPRIHGVLSRKVRIEQPAASEPFVERLRHRFLNVTVKAPYSYSMGAVQAIQFGPDRTLIGMADPRRDGTAAGL